MRPSPLAWCPSVLTLVALALGTSGCASSGPHQILSVESLEPGEECPEGGTVIQHGTDHDGDGVLDDDEVEGVHIVCHGDTPVEAGDLLVTSTELDRGDEDCPHGGIRIDIGRDDGAGGGTADDGELQEGEIEDTHFFCHPAPLYDIGLLDPPEGPAGQYTIDLSGGAGEGGEGSSGGAGGALVFGGQDGGEAGLPGGNVKIFRTGEVDASFSLPPRTTWLGPNPAVIEGETTVEVAPTSGGVIFDPEALTEGELYMLHSDPSLYRWEGEHDPDAPITGLHVEAGATLTLPTNSASSRTQLSLAQDLVNEGTVTTEARRHLDLTVDGAFHGFAGSALDLSGREAFQSATLDLEVGHGVFNEGAILGYSDDSPGTYSGASGHTVAIEGREIYNTGAILARGGAGADGGEGGNGGRVTLTSQHGGVYNSGDIDAQGTDGGEAGQIVLESHWGDVRNTGTLDASSTACPTDGCAIASAGAWGASLRLEAQGGGVYSSGDLLARGGDDPQGTAWDGGAGAGGDIVLRATDQELFPAGSIEISGHIDAAGGSGGSGSQGGPAGSVRVDLSTRSTPSPEIIFYGYTDVLLDGGVGDHAGGDGGEATLFNGCPRPPSPPGDVATVSTFSSPGTHLPPGGIATFADFSLRGGDGDAQGGRGGIYGGFTCLSPEFAHQGGAVFLTAGDLDHSGGSTTDPESDGGDGGFVFKYTRDWAETRGAIRAPGGDGGEGGGGEGGDLILFAIDGQVTQSGSFDGSGGSSHAELGDGGDSGEALLLGALVDSSGDLVLRGGDGGVDEGRGGDGGDVELSSLADTSQRTGALDLSPGQGPDGDGATGRLYVDGESQDPDDLP